MTTTPFLQNCTTKTTQISIFIGKIGLGSTVYNSSSLLNLTVTGTGSHRVLLLLSALHLQLFDAQLEQKHFNKALVCVCCILRKTIVHRKGIGRGIFPSKDDHISSILSSLLAFAQSFDNDGAVKKQLLNMQALIQKKRKRGVLPSLLKPVLSFLILLLELFSVSLRG